MPTINKTPPVKHNALARHRPENPEFDQFVSGLTNSRGQQLRWQRAHNAALREETNVLQDPRDAAGQIP
jgi:hypothetical protein